MNGSKVAFYILVYVIVVCPLYVLAQSSSKAGGQAASYGEPGVGAGRRCDSCPRRGRCVPRVSCPAHVRRGAARAACHPGGAGVAGVCCYTGARHAAEFESSPQQRSAVPAVDAKSAHNASVAAVDKMYRRARSLLDHPGTVVREGTPDYGLHLSWSGGAGSAARARGALQNLVAARQLRARRALADEDLELGLTHHAAGPFCPPLPSCPEPPARYRALAGECNHASHPTWGAADTAYERLLPPDYSDGLWALRVSASGLPLASARAVSAALLPDAAFPSPEHNMLFMQTSQFLAHDVSAAAVYTTENSSAISCCSPDGQPLPPEFLHFACIPIDVDPADEFYGHFGRTCLNIVRAQLAPSPDCTVGYANPMNGATHFLDLSQLYGKTPEKLELLRSGALMKTFTDYGRELPPLTERKECMAAREHGACFESGDQHGNQVISLTALHTIFTREHNRLARSLARLNPLWDGDTLFFEARRILQAMYQHIVYGEWLPLVIGPHFMEAFKLNPSPGYSTWYDPDTNAALLTEFAAAAMRFGHSTVDGKITIPYTQSGSLYEAVSLPEVMFDPSRMRLRPFLDRLLAGLAAQPMQNVDPFITEALTRYMFHGGQPHGLDLASINLQRGRDFGLRPYNQYRALVGLEPYSTFHQFPPSASKRLSSVYESPEDIDLYVGGLLEEPVEGGIVGPTFANIIAEQFARLKLGDRYYYEHGPDTNPAAFSPSQLAEIKKITLSRIICDNRDGIELTSMPPQAFLRSDLPENSPVPCDSTIIPHMDLTRFRVM